MEQQTQNVDPYYINRTIYTKIIEILMWIILMIGVVYLCYNFVIANYAVNDLILNGNATSLLDLYTKTTGHECMIIQSNHTLHS